MLSRVSKTILRSDFGSLKKISAACYHENVIDHYENPRNVGTLDKNKKNVGTGLVGAPACGDVMRMQIEVGRYPIFLAYLSDSNSIPS